MRTPPPVCYGTNGRGTERDKAKREYGPHDGPRGETQDRNAIISAAFP